MTTLLDETLKWERLREREDILTLSPVTLKLTLKGKRKGRGSFEGSGHQRRCKGVGAQYVKNR